jgi:hypothetical protein
LGTAGARAIASWKIVPRKACANQRPPSAQSVTGRPVNARSTRCQRSSNAVATTPETIICAIRISIPPMTLRIRTTTALRSLQRDRCQIRGHPKFNGIPAATPALIECSDFAAAATIYGALDLTCMAFMLVRWRAHL